MSPQTQGTPQDEQAIRNMVTQFVAAWNRNDAKALAGQFTSDGDLINPAGRIARGKGEVEKLLAEEQSGRFKGTHMSMTLKHLRFLKPDVAIVDEEFEITGLQGPQTTMKGLITVVLRKDGDHWLTTSARPMVPVQMPG
jgi:uncharacterized protein (TIGR02246 family)